MGMITKRSTSSWHAMNVGRNANNGANAGLFYLNCNNSSGTVNRNIGRQLAGSFVIEGGVIISRVHTQIVSPITLGSFGEKRGGHQQ